MKKAILLVAVLCIALSGSTLWASGSSYPTATTAPVTDPTQVTETMKCEVIAIAEGGKVKIKDPKTQEESWIVIHEDTKLVAKNKKAFDGRKKLDPTDVAVGQLLRITHRPHTGEVVRIKVLDKA